MSMQALEELRGQDWKSLLPRLVGAATIIAARYGWSPDRSLPKGKTIEDLVGEAIKHMFDQPDRRRMDVPLLTQLTNIVRHKLWNLRNSEDAKVCRPGELDPTEHRPHHEERTDGVDEFQRAVSLLLEVPKVKQNEELSLVMTAIGLGFLDPPEIVKETGLSRERVYQLRRELKELFPQIAAQLCKEGDES